MRLVQLKLMQRWFVPWVIATFVGTLPKTNRDIAFLSLCLMTRAKPNLCYSTRSRQHLHTLLRQRYPGHTSLDDIAQVARHDTTIPPELSPLIGQKFKLLVYISKKWRNKQ